LNERRFWFRFRKELIIITETDCVNILKKLINHLGEKSSEIEWATSFMYMATDEDIIRTRMIREILEFIKTEMKAYK